jgi:queuine/archaeosine tRNA-ribosyltransferase
MSTQQVIHQDQEPVEITPRNKGRINIDPSGVEYCPVCQREYRHKDYLDHLFRNKECMRAYWQEEERTHAYRVRHRSLNRKKEREALARQQEQSIRTTGTVFA